MTDETDRMVERLSSLPNHLEEAPEPAPVVRRHPLARCEECPLYGEAGPVNGTGPSGHVKVAIVGEAPGFQEGVVKRPFVGPSGQILDELLRNNGIVRKDVFITNTVLCRPPENENPSAAALACCAPRLADDLIANQPDYVIAMGAVASKALGFPGAITKLRVGPPRRVELLQEGQVALETLVIPTLHPAFALRSPDALPSIDLDISKVHGVAASDWREPALIVVTEHDDALKVLGELMEMAGPFAVDIETGWEKDDVDFHADQQEILCIGVAYAKDKVVVFSDQCLCWGAVQDALKTFLTSKPLIWQNGKSDLAGLFPMLDGVTANLTYDTMLEHYVLDERRGIHGLEPMAVEFLGVPPWKHRVTPYLSKGAGKNFADIPKEVLWPYNAIDCSTTYRMHELWSRMLEEQGRMGTHDMLVAGAAELVHLEMDGIGFDMEYSRELSEQYQDEISDVEQRMEDLIGKRINPNSPKQILALMAEFGVKPPTLKRKPTTAAEPLAKWLELGKFDHVPALMQWITLLLTERRQLTKDDGTFCQGMQKVAVDHGEDATPRHRVHTTYTLHVTNSGRLSSKSPNLQNVKDDARLRRQFVAGEGKLLLQGDYSQVEGRVIAALSGDDYLGTLFRNTERDIFDEISVAMYGKPMPQRRRLIKTFFYGQAYGRTAHGIARGFNMPIDEAQAQLDQFKELIPGVTSWQDETWQKVLDDGYLETTFGRRRHFPLITNANKQDMRNEALAFVPQSTASDICLTAFTLLRPYTESYYGKADVRLTIHDAIVVECDEAWVDLVKIDMKAFMVGTGDRWTYKVGADIPFQVAFKSGNSWDQLG